MVISFTMILKLKKKKKYHKLKTLHSIIHTGVKLD